MTQLTKSIENYLNPLTTAQWLEKAMAAPVLSSEADSLLQSLINVESIYREAAAHYPAGCKMKSPVYLDVEVDIDTLTEFHTIMGEHTNLNEPDFRSQYHWIMIGHFAASDVVITLHTPEISNK